MRNLLRKEKKTISLSDLYDLIDSENIVLDEIKLPNAKSLSMMDIDDKQCFIAIDTASIGNQAEEKVRLAHELGHCQTASFRNIYSPADLVCKHEYNANRQAVLDLVPYDDFIDAIRRGNREKWELAEYFEVTEDFIEEVVKHYTAMGKDFKYK